MLNYLWGGFFLVGFAVAMLRFLGGDDAVFQAVVQSTFDMAKLSVEIAIGLIGLLALWSGLFRIAEQAGVTNDAGWAPVEAYGMTSKMDENIHVLGDASQQGDMPKSGFSANSQAKVCAMSVRGALTGSKVFPAKFSNTCWSLIDSDDGIKVGASYEATDEKIKNTGGFISKVEEDAATRKATYEESVGWYSGITTDMFG